MIRSCLALFLGCFLGGRPAPAQARVEVVDLSANVGIWSAEAGIDSIFLEQEQVFMGLMEQWLERLREKYIYYQRLAEGSHNPQIAGLEEQLNNSIVADQQALLSAEAYFIDTLGAYKLELLGAIQTKIWNIVDSLNQSAEHRMIVFREAIIYYEEDYPTRALEIPLEAVHREPLQARLKALELEMIIAYTRYFGLMEEIGPLDLGQSPLKE